MLDAVEAVLADPTVGFGCGQARRLVLDSAASASAVSWSCQVRDVRVAVILGSPSGP